MIGESGKYIEQMDMSSILSTSSAVLQVDALKYKLIPLVAFNQRPEVVKCMHLGRVVAASINTDQR
jgi:hypothetical protein